MDASTFHDIHLDSQNWISTDLRVPDVTLGQTGFQPGELHDEMQQ